MERTSINPSDWGQKFFMDQAELVQGAVRHLRCSGQISVVPDAAHDLGFRVVAPHEMKGQLQRSLKNVDEILEHAGMKRENIVALRFFTTDIDEFLNNYNVYADWIAVAGICPPQSLIGVQRLVLPELVVEIEVEAAV